MFSEFFWILSALTVINSILLIAIIFKFKKQERFQTDEAHTNLEIINQSLNRLSDVAERLELINSSSQTIRAGKSGLDINNLKQSKEKRAREMIRQGDDPRRISRHLGLPRSEIELILASEKLTDSKYVHRD